jgi:hypothetical protein
MVGTRAGSIYSWVVETCFCSVCTAGAHGASRVILERAVSWLSSPWGFPRGSVLPALPARRQYQHGTITPSWRTANTAGTAGICRPPGAADTGTQLEAAGSNTAFSISTSGVHGCLCSYATFQQQQHNAIFSIVLGTRGCSILLCSAAPHLLLLILLTSTGTTGGVRGCWPHSRPANG